MADSPRLLERDWEGLPFKASLAEHGKFALWRRIHSLSHPYIQLWQDSKLRSLLAYTNRHIPFYRSLWSSRGASISDIRKVEDLGSLPLTSKKIFIASNPATYVRQDLPQYLYRWNSTSGSTGEPFKFIRAVYSPTELHKRYVDSKQRRFLLWEGMTHKELLQINESGVFHLNCQGVPIRALYNQPRETISQMHNFKGDVLESYPSVLVDTIQFIREYKLTPPVFMYVVAAGENVTEAYRELIEDTFQCTLFDRYSSEEFWGIGLECREHHGFHIHSESYIVEIVDENGIPLPPGQHGKVVVTDLFNRIMPFIRYELGDCGMILPDPCPCGLHTPRLVMEGRDSLFLTLDGRRINHFELVGLMERYTQKVLRYQIRKLDEHRVEVRVVASDTIDDNVAGSIRKDFDMYLKRDVHITVQQVKDIERTPTGKSKVVIDMTNPIQVQRLGDNSELTPLVRR